MSATTMPHWQERVYRSAPWLLAAAFGSVVLALLYGAFCHFSGKAWPLADYGRYVNAIYNSGHGHFLRYAMEENYLLTHLSFTLALIAPLFRIWDHVLLLVLVQWAMLIGGSLILFRSVRAQDRPAWMALSLCLFYAGYALTQSVMLMDFHGTCLYLLFIPWLYHSLGRQRSLVWLPLLLLLGLREDAFLMVLPMLLYFSVRDRWKAGYVYAGCALLYGLTAMFLLYPAINGVSLFAHRQEEINASVFTWFLSWETLEPRLVSLFWIGLPVAPLLLGGGRPVLVFMALPVITTLFSDFKGQHELTYHYPAIIMATMCCGIAESWARLKNTTDLPRWRRPSTMALYLLIVLVYAHVTHGLLWGGARHRPLFTSIHGRGARLLEALPHIPKEGVLLCTRSMAGACANRVDLWTWHQHRRQPGAYQPDVLFCSLSDLIGPLKEYASALLAAGTFGVPFQNGEFFVMVRGADTVANQELIALIEREAATMYLARTHNKSGVDRDNAAGQRVRSWEGAEDARPRLLSFGKGIVLEAGTYRAELFYQTDEQVAGASEPLLQWSLHPLNRSRVLAETDVFKQGPSDGPFSKALLTFRLEETTRVEARIRGGRVPVDLYKVVYSPGTASSIR